MTSTGSARKYGDFSGHGYWWITALVLLLLLPLVAAGTASAADTEPPEWGNATRGNATTIDVSLYDNGTIDESTISKDDFRLSAGRIENATVTSINASGANRTGARVSLHLANKVDEDNVTVRLRNEGSITDTAGNELPKEAVTATGMDAVLPKYMSFEVTRINASTAEISVETHEPLSALTISVGGESLDTLNISGFDESTGNTAVYTRPYTFPEEGEYSLLLMQVVDENGNENTFGRQRSFRYDGTAPNVTVEGPENATVGEPVNFSAANSTDDQGIESIRWRLGRGTLLTGERIRIAFATPGTHEVVAEATDPMGNTATATRLVEVTGNGVTGNVTVRRINETTATAAVNGNGQTQRLEPDSGSLVTDGTVRLERLDASFPVNESVNVSVRSRERAPTSFGDATGRTALGRFDVDHGDQPARDVAFIFAVDRDAINDAGATPTDVTLYRDDGDWTPLETEVASRSESTILYRASSPGLSTFVVGAENTTAEREAADATEADSEDADDAETDDTATETPAPQQKSGTPDIVLTNATADPSSLEPGDRTVLTAELENRGTATGDHQIVVAVNGTILTTRTVTVPPGETRSTEFARAVPEESAGPLTVDGEHVANVTAGGGFSIPALPSLSLPNPLSLWPNGIVGTILGGLIGLLVVAYSVLKGLAIYLGY